MPASRLLRRARPLIRPPRPGLGGVLLLVVSVALSGVSRAHAQAVTGALAGHVLSEEGQPLEEIVVTVGGAALQGERHIVSDTRGRFLFPALPAGAYTVQLRRIGYTPLRVTDVTVVLGGTTSLGELRLAPKAVELQEIVVSGARPLVDPTTAAAVTALDSSTFLAVPTERNYRALLQLVPEATPSPYGDGTNVAGATGLENGYFVDGIHVTDPNQANGSLNLPYNFVREVQVTTGGYEAEYGRTQGGVVNVITNAGGNELHGQVLGFFAGDGLQAEPRWGTGQAQVNKFSQYDVGASLGGPIRRDRLWFYLAYNPTVENSDANVPGLGTLTDSRTSHLFAGKLTGRLGAATDVTLTVLGDPSTRNYVGSMGPAFPLPPTVNDTNVVLGLYQQGGMAAALQVRHPFSDRTFLTASLAHLSSRNDNGPRAGTTTDLAALARVEDHVTNSASGNFGSWGTTRTTRTSGQVGLRLLEGTHAIKLGVEFEENTITSEGLFSLVTVDAGPTYSWLTGEGNTHAHTSVPTGYVQDSWAVSRRLRLNLGLRMEAQHFAGDVGTAFWIGPYLAPRVGVVFQPGGLGLHKAYASFGRFFEEIPLVATTLWHGSGSQVFTTYPQSPLVDTTGGVAQGGSWAGTPADQNIRGQHYDEWTAGYERGLGRAYRVGVRGTYRTMLWVVEDGARDPSSTFIVGNPGRGALAYLPRATRDYAALELTFEKAGRGPLTFLASYVLSRNRGNYTGLFATDVVHPVANGGPQFDFPEQTVDAWGPLPNDRTHVMKFVGSYRFPFSLTVGTSALLASGAPLSEYGTGPFTPYWTFIRPRGTAGRTPTTWTMDLRFAYDVPVALGSRVRPRVVLDVFNIGNQRRALTYDQRHYTQPNLGGVNPNYGAVTQYQAPLRARVGLLLNF
jgi:Carboxypeptidase regulatory-like domain/TonB-dependent Receptor Plug Domain